MKVYYDADCDINLITGKKIAIARLWQPGPRPCAEPARFGRQGSRHRAASRFGHARQKAEAPASR
jgi:hypothetical protein